MSVDFFRKMDTDDFVFTLKNQDMNEILSDVQGAHGSMDFVENILNENPNIGQNDKYSLARFLVFSDIFLHSFNLLGEIGKVGMASEAKTYEEAQVARKKNLVFNSIPYWVKRILFLGIMAVLIHFLWTQPLNSEIFNIQIPPLLQNPNFTKVIAGLLFSFAVFYLMRGIFVTFVAIHATREALIHYRVLEVLNKINKDMKSGEVKQFQLDIVKGFSLDPSRFAMLLRRLGFKVN